MIFRTYDDIIVNGERVKFLRRSRFFPNTGYVRRQNGRITRVDITEATLAPCVLEMAMDAISVAFGIEAAE